MAHLSKHLVRGSFQGFSANNRAYGDDILPARSQGVPYIRHGENRTDADQRITGANDNALSMADRLQDFRCRSRRLGTLELDPANDGFGVPFDEVFLKMKPAFA